MTIYKNIPSVRTVTWDNKVWVLQKMVTETKKVEASNKVITTFKGQDKQ